LNFNTSRPYAEDATPQQRASLIASLMLVEFAHFEWKKGDNNAGAGLGGG